MLNRHQFAFLGDIERLGLQISGRPEAPETEAECPALLGDLT